MQSTLTHLVNAKEKKLTVLHLIVHKITDINDIFVQCVLSLKKGV